MSVTMMAQRTERGKVSQLVMAAIRAFVPMDLLAVQGCIVPQVNNNVI